MTTCPTQPLTLIAGAPLVLTVDSDFDLTPYTVKAALVRGAPYPVAATITEGAGIVKGPTSFTLTFTAQQTARCGAVTMLAVQLFSGADLQLEDSISLTVKANLIP